jgi:2-(1,2-epoxy-1,2-dihydrophenyl)acetyl-CoA isomerase
VTVVRRARVEDAGGIARVWARAWQISYRDLVPDGILDAIDVEQRRALWISRLEAGDRTFVVDDLGIAGYCRLVLPGEVAGLYVLPERRRGGIGSALLTAGLDELRAHGVHATLWVFTDNHSARAFYTRFGFTPDGGTRIEASTGLEEIRLRAEL